MTRILGPAPEFRARAVGPGGRQDLSLADFAGRYLVLAFYPRDFTVVCPTEVIELSKRAREFEELGAAVVAVSTDDLETHERWIAEKLGPLAIPLAADPGGVNAKAWGAYIAAAAVAGRATFIVDPRGMVQFASFHPIDVGRSVSELLRVIEALKTGQKAPADWQPGKATLGQG